MQQQQKGLQYLLAACLITRRIQDKLFKILIYFLVALGLRCCPRAFSLLRWAGSTLGCTLQVLEHGLSGCGAQASLLCGVWDLARPEMEPTSPALADGFLTTGPPGKSLYTLLIWTCVPASNLCLGPLSGASSEGLPGFWFPTHPQDPLRLPWLMYCDQLCLTPPSVQKLRSQGWAQSPPPCLSREEALPGLRNWITEVNSITKEV